MSDDFKPLQNALKQYQDSLQFIGGCGDSNCVVVRPKGWRTNGGCTCYADSKKARSAMSAASVFKKRVEDYLDAKIPKAP